MKTVSLRKLTSTLGGGLHPKRRELRKKRREPYGVFVSVYGKDTTPYVRGRSKTFNPRDEIDSSRKEGNLIGP